MSDVSSIKKKLISPSRRIKRNLISLALVSAFSIASSAWMLGVLITFLWERHKASLVLLLLAVIMAILAAIAVGMVVNAFNAYTQAVEDQARHTK